MPTIQDNISLWEKTYDWSQKGNEWSSPWGCAAMQWYGSILPRIQAFVPAHTILEIGPGFGRWTRYLKDLCSQLLLVDLSKKCMDASKKIFEECTHIAYFVNDGRSLDMIHDGVVDFIFSLDSLVHAEEDVMHAYVAEFSRKLKPDGVAFVHHSNLEAYRHYVRVNSILNRITRRQDFMRKMGMDDVLFQWRARSVSARKIVSYCEMNGLKCIGQELITWNTRRALIDCFSIVVKKGSKWERDNRVLKNRSFMKEANHLSRIGRLYGSLQQQGQKPHPV